MSACFHCARSKKQHRLASSLEAMAMQREAMAQREAVGQTIDILTERDWKLPKPDGPMLVVMK